MNKIVHIFVAFAVGCALSASSLANENGYQYVSIFNGDFPIPTRYQLVAWSDAALEYSSPAPTRKQSSLLWKEVPAIGLIRIGKTVDLNEELGRKVQLKRIGACGPITIERAVLSPEFVDEYPKDFPLPVVLLGKKNYVAINDTDDNLWKTLVRNYAANLQIPGRDCSF